jgi:hypothetical protein
MRIAALLLLLTPAAVAGPVEGPVPTETAERTEESVQADLCVALPLGTPRKHVVGWLRERGALLILITTVTYLGGEDSHYVGYVAPGSGRLALPRARIRLGLFFENERLARMTVGAGG